MRTIEDLRISPAPWQVRDIVPLEGSDDPCGKWLVDGDGNDLITELEGNGIDGIEANAHLIAAAPELLAFAAAYYERHKRNAVKVNPQNGDKYQDGMMVMCKQALVKAGMMDENEVWKEDGNESE